MGKYDFLTREEFNAKTDLVIDRLENLHRLKVKENKRLAGIVDDFEQVLAAALKLLDRKMYTVFELSKKLKDKDIGTPKLRGRVVRRLQELKLLDDLEYARSWIRTRTRLSPKGTYVLRMELLKKKVDKAVIESAFQTEPVDEVALARAMVLKKKAQLQSLPPEKQYQRVLGLLQRRGFSYGVAKRAWEELHN